MVKIKIRGEEVNSLKSLKDYNRFMRMNVL